MRILLVGDDAPLANFLRKGLEQEHYGVDVAGDGQTGVQLALEVQYDTMVLDLNIPKLEVAAVWEAVRALKAALPVLILTGRGGVDERVRLLDMVADDYLVKPFSFSKLSARVRALIRRGTRAVNTVLQAADLTLDRVSRQVDRAGKRADLTSKEFALWSTSCAMQVAQ